MNPSNPSDSAQDSPGCFETVEISTLEIKTRVRSAWFCASRRGSGPRVEHVHSNGQWSPQNLSSSWRCSKRSISIFRERFSSSREALPDARATLQHMQRCIVASSNHLFSAVSCHKLHAWGASKDHPFQAAAYEETFRHWERKCEFILRTELNAKFKQV